MKDNVLQLINAHINAELASAYVYLAMAAQADDWSWRGLATWMQAQAKEEIDHAMGFYHYLIDRNARVELLALEKPTLAWDNPPTLAQAVLAHEQSVTAKIHNLYELAVTEKDYPLQTLLKWYIDEQVEEEAGAQDLVDGFVRAGEDRGAWLVLDQELSKRAYQRASILK